MPIQPSFQPPPLGGWISSQFTTENGWLTNRAAIYLQNVQSYVNGTNRIIPCNASTSVSNVITLTMLQVQPLVQGYASFDTYAFVADFTVTGNVSAFVVTSTGSLNVCNVYKNNGAAQATTGDITQGLQYMLTFADNLNSNAGGFVLR